MKSDRALNFKGTHKEIGEQVGLLYKKWGSIGIQIPSFSDKYYPEFLDFLDGVAKAKRIEKDKMYKFGLTIFLGTIKKIVERNCSCFVVKNNNGVLIGRNYDWFESSEKNSKLITYEFTDKSSLNIKGTSDMGTFKRGFPANKSEFALVLEDGWNEKGFFIELNGAPGNKVTVGLSPVHLIQLIAEKCQTIDQAQKMIEEIPSTNSQIFTLADKEGNMAVVEKSLDKGLKVRRSKNFIIATNHYLHPDLISLNAQMFKKVPFHSSFARYHYLEANLLNKWSKLNFQDTITLLKKPPTLQNWRGIRMGDTITDWILSLNLVDGKYCINFAPLLSGGVNIFN